MQGLECNAQVGRLQGGAVHDWGIVVYHVALCRATLLPEIDRHRGRASKLI